MNAIFYVSSWGGSATTWLARALDNHPEIECFHGIKWIPGDALEKYLLPEDFAEMLASRETEATFVGSVHGYHGTIMEQLILDRGGKFAFCTRNPIQRISSLYNGHREKLSSGINAQRYQVMFNEFIVNNKEMFEHFAGLNLIRNYQEIDGRITMHIDDLIFVWMAGLTVYWDRTYLKAKGPIFRMEDYTVNQKVFQKVFHHMTQGQLTCNAAYLQEVFSVGRVNRHRKTRGGNVYEFRNWRPNHKQIFYTMAADKKELLKLYKDLNYWEVPRLLEVWRDCATSAPAA